MSTLRVLFIGGGGLISSACSRAAVERGIDLTIVTRGTNTRHSLPEGVVHVQADARDEGSLSRSLDKREFDAVVDFIAFTPEDIERDLRLFTGRTGQYIFISTTSVYRRPIAQLPVVESTPRRNAAWPYPKNKIACELLLEQAYREQDFPVTIVRPCHTYDRGALPMHGGWTVVDRMRRGKAVVVHGDGTSLWTLTHHRDFARGFVVLLGNPHAIGDTVHITSEEILNWDQIYRCVASAAGVEARIVHRSSEQIAEVIPDWGPSLIADFAHSLIFDNTKIRRFAPGFVATVPFATGAREIINWYDANPSLRQVDPVIDAALDCLVEPWPKHP